MMQKYTLYGLGLFWGDLAFLLFSLWVTLLVRYGTLPTEELFFSHFYPFAYIFSIWVVVYFIYDLYRRQLYFFSKKIITALFNAHIVNSIIAIIFFYLIPYFGINPRINLFIFLIISFLFLWLWRVYIAHYIFYPNSETLFFACQGQEVEELQKAFTSNYRYGVNVCQPVDDLSKIKEIYPEASLVAISAYNGDLENETDSLYQNLFSGLRFVNVESLYEELFGRVPLSLISHRWFLDHISIEKKPIYDTFKRLIDILTSLMVGLVFLVFLGPVALAIKLSDGGPIFFLQSRVGRHGQVFNLLKFRSMKDGRVTTVGRWLRLSRIDELPQFWNLLKGEVSLVGPRPERLDYVEKYRQLIPFYDVRHLAAPGLSGWAQIYHDNHPHFAPAVEATREKFSYDLYYLKQRSLVLDLIIIVKTIRILISQNGK